MTSIRLPVDVEMKLAEIAKLEKRTKSDIIKKALYSYLESYFIRSSPYDLGKDLFGNYGSSQSNLSTDYKKLIKERMDKIGKEQAIKELKKEGVLPENYEEGS